MSALRVIGPRYASLPEYLAAARAVAAKQKTIEHRRMDPKAAGDIEIKPRRDRVAADLRWGL